MKLKELKQLAESAPLWDETNAHNIHHLKSYNKAANPQTILAMIALIEQMGEALRHDALSHIGGSMANEALAVLEAFENGEQHGKD